MLKDNEIIKDKTSFLPVLPIRGVPVFPYMIIHFDVGRDKSVNAIEESMVENQQLFLLAQKNPELETITPDDLYTVGTVAKIKQILKISENDIRVLVEGVSRARVVKFTSTSPFFECEIEKYTPKTEYTDEEIATQDAYIREINKYCQTYFNLLGKHDREPSVPLSAIKDAERFADSVAAVVNMEIDTKQSVLEEYDLLKRLERLLAAITSEIEILKIQRQIGSRVKEKIDDNQREHFLREQIKVIQDELGDGETSEEECEEYYEKLAAKGAPDYVLEKAQSELSKLRRMQGGHPDANVVRNYLEWLCDIPWISNSEDNMDLKLASRILDRDHYGLKKVKERIVEFLAVRMLSAGRKSPIICLVGPPGVGKTSVVKSIARAMGRKYVRMSLGGVRDEAEIRGHRKTYIGAMPGRIISAMKQADTKNPVILLDEIDKLGQDHRGSIFAALLEVLDSEQNFSFRDHYLELEYDLSEVLFVTTANSLDTIDRPLLDRMEVIELSGYTDREKLKIAKQYIIPKQIEEHGLTKNHVKINDAAILDIINEYTKESGVRELERQIAKIMRKAACLILSDEKKLLSVGRKNLEEVLGSKLYPESKDNMIDEVGVATGLAWTMFGGATLSVEVNVMSGSGAVELTGQLGDVMKESAKAAISYIRANCKKFGVEEDFHKKYDIHIHVPEGAVPKDGPSAGITMATAIISALSGRKVSKKVAMTGEITISGKVLAIGGLKEKALAAHRHGADTVLIPRENMRDIAEIPEEVKEKLNFVPVDSMDKVLEYALK